MIAQTPNPGGLLRRLIPLIVQPCELPRASSAGPGIDFTDPTRRKEAFDRLLRNLGRSAQRDQRGQHQGRQERDRRAGGAARESEGSSPPRSYEESIAEASGLIGGCGRYKRLHDYFQQRGGCLQAAALQERAMPTGVDTWDRLEGSARELANELERML